MNSFYAANQPYTHRGAFQIPNTVLEPADINADNGILRLNRRPFNLTTLSYGNPGLLQAIATAPIKPASYAANKYNWSYQSRHSAQPVLPFLYLGPASVARDGDYVTKTGITMVISVRNASSARTQPRWLDPSLFAACSGLQTATFDVDNPYEFITRIRPIIKFMTDHLDAQTHGPIRGLEDVGGAILVICESGNERSPALVAAYLMLLYGISWHESLNLIHTHRFSVCLSSGMNDMLKTWQGILQAESDVARRIDLTSGDLADGPRYTRQSKKAMKRSIDDAYDSEDTIIDDEVTVRPGIAPFMDIC